MLGRQADNEDALRLRDRIVLRTGMRGRLRGEGAEEAHLCWMCARVAEAAHLPWAVGGGRLRIGRWEEALGRIGACFSASESRGKVVVFERLEPVSVRTSQPLVLLPKFPWPSGCSLRPHRG